jgi:hypothetical protein
MRFCTALCYFPHFVLGENLSGNRKAKNFCVNGTGQMKWYTSNIARGTKRAVLHRDCMLRPRSRLLKEAVEAQAVSKLPLRHSTTSSLWMEISTALSTSDVREYVTGVSISCTVVCKK